MLFRPGFRRFRDSENAARVRRRSCGYAVSVADDKGHGLFDDSLQLERPCRPAGGKFRVGGL